MAAASWAAGCRCCAGASRPCHVHTLSRRSRNAYMWCRHSQAFVMLTARLFQQAECAQARPAAGVFLIRSVKGTAGGRGGGCAGCPSWRRQHQPIRRLRRAAENSSETNSSPAAGVLRVGCAKGAATGRRAVHCAPAGAHRFIRPVGLLFGCLARRSSIACLGAYSVTQRRHNCLIHSKPRRHLSGGLTLHTHVCCHHRSTAAGALHLHTAPTGIGCGSCASVKPSCRHSAKATRQPSCKPSPPNQSICKCRSNWSKAHQWSRACCGAPLQLRSLDAPPPRNNKSCCVSDWRAGCTNGVGPSAQRCRHLILVIMQEVFARSVSLPEQMSWREAHQWSRVCGAAPSQPQFPGAPRPP